MPTSQSHLQYPALRKIMDQIVDDPDDRIGGATLTVGEYGQAVKLRQQIYSVRKAEREKLKRIYPMGDVRWGTSPYDALSVSIKAGPDGRWLVTIAKDLNPAEVKVDFFGPRQEIEPATEPPAEPLEPGFFKGGQDAE